MSKIRIALVGVGKIARDQHVPAIGRDPGLELVAACSRNAAIEGIPSFADFDEMLAAVPEIDAVSLCTPPNARLRYALSALDAGKHVILEKPPAATISEIQPVIQLAKDSGKTLFATWHSRFADAVEPARAWLRDAEIQRATVSWKEDVRHWHPGQDWIWEPGGLGVFDPGINGLSILTAILPDAVHLTQSTLFFPQNRAQPIAADLTLSTTSGIPVDVRFDWRETRRQAWTIEVETTKGRLAMSDGGAGLTIDGETIVKGSDREYPGIYAHFADLVRAGRSDVDLAPMLLVADAFLLGRRETVERFDD